MRDFNSTISDALGFNDEQLLRLIARSPYSYKIYTIPKKTGGVRTIAQPARETKFIQHWLINNLFAELPVHECASAYKLGASIKLNAATHQHHSYISKFDFAAFFESISIDDLISHFKRHLKHLVSECDIKSVARLSCIRPKTGGKLRLSIGAPSSPLLSNSVMHEFDENIHQWCNSRNFSYTRYADDLTFSTDEKGVSVEIETFLRSLLNDLEYPRLLLNESKTIHISKKNQRRITGIIINNDGELSAGRARKRAISSMIHHFSNGSLILADVYKLQGLLGFVNDVESIFLNRMRKKYGGDVIDAILNTRKRLKNQ